MNDTSSGYLCSALGTPLTQDELLHREGLMQHVDQQVAVGIDGLLVGGSMGMMQLLKDDTYHDLVRLCVSYCKRRAELFVGVGDTSFYRTRERIRFVNDFEVDGILLLAPYFVPFSQTLLVEYFESLAEESRAPLYLYDIPQRTGVSLSLESIMQLAAHPKIVGIKCSGDLTEARRLCELMAGTDFRVVKTL